MHGSSRPTHFALFSVLRLHSWPVLVVLGGPSCASQVALCRIHGCFRRKMVLGELARESSHLRHLASGEGCWQSSAHSLSSGVPLDMSPQTARPHTTVAVHACAGAEGTCRGRPPLAAEVDPRVRIVHVRPGETGGAPAQPSARRAGSKRPGTGEHASCRPEGTGGTEIRRVHRSGVRRAMGALRAHVVLGRWSNRGQRTCDCSSVGNAQMCRRAQGNPQHAGM